MKKLNSMASPAPVQYEMASSEDVVRDHSLCTDLLLNPRVGRSYVLSNMVPLNGGLVNDGIVDQKVACSFAPGQGYCSRPSGNGGPRMTYRNVSSTILKAQQDTLRSVERAILNYNDKQQQRTDAICRKLADPDK